jgi:hypothetical protein
MDIVVVFVSGRELPDYKAYQACRNEQQCASRSVLDHQLTWLCAMSLYIGLSVASSSFEPHWRGRCQMDISEDRSIQFRVRQLQHTFRHAASFGIVGNANRKTLFAFQLALTRHVESPKTMLRNGYYRNRAVTHFVDIDSRLNVMRLHSGDYLSAWRLSSQQLECLLRTGRLGGGQHEQSS